MSVKERPLKLLNFNLMAKELTILLNKRMFPINTKPKEVSFRGHRDFYLKTAAS